MNKKRVAIISRHAYPNYGSFFQAYALQCAIDEMGYDAFYINYQKKDEQSWRLALSSLKESKMNTSIIRKIIYLILQAPNYLLMNKRFNNFHKRYLKLSKAYSSCSDIRKDLPEADIYMTGSDQVWNSIHNKIDDTYFLSFIDESYYKVSYAASFGKDHIPKEEIENIRQNLLQFKHITVRESSGVSILNSLGLNGQSVLDPVFLMSKEQWEKLIKKSGQIYKKYILVYQLHSNEEFDGYVDLLCKEINMQVIRISTDYKQFKKTGRLSYLPEPSEVLMLFKDAELIITDSFHATAFSIIFNKNFQVILPFKNSSRLIDLLEMLDLEKVIVRVFNTVQRHNTIDYVAVVKILRGLKNMSKDYLMKILRENNYC